MNVALTSMSGKTRIYNKGPTTELLTPDPTSTSDPDPRTSPKGHTHITGPLVPAPASQSAVADGQKSRRGAEPGDSLDVDPSNPGSEVHKCK